MLSRRYLPSMPSLLALEAVDRTGSASAAAAELNLTQGAISRQLQVLEGQLGLSLIIRDKQRLRLTAAAQDYCREIRRALQALSQASLTLRANPNGGTLNLAILPAFGMHWLAPRLARFAAQHPEVTVNLSTRLRPFDFANSHFDAAIHYGRQDWPGVDYLPLMAEELLAVAAPDLLKAPLSAANEILSYPLLQLESRTGDWGRWLAHHGHPNQRPPAMLFDQFATMAQGAIHGLGVALLPVFLIERELAEHRLVPAFGPPIPSLGSYYLVWPKDAASRAPLTSFRNWITAERDA
ncbi:MAG: LysR family transcriptional regulator [Cypionkella sp.]|uniref:LysR family transcriptional regulator n=1 Tax=Cypionkella sp. TaxID=2811411 RepID=UPI0026240EE8|nr:LysR family transcriptional regulator [Cypionkella sp.]MDB5660053.1 LysR family transcriptional regulator [Cypionkella sp.]